MNALYTSALVALLDGALDLKDGDVRAILVEIAGGYTFSAAHDFLDDVPAGARVGSAVALTGKSITGGVFNASSPITFTTPPDGRQVDAWVLYLHTGTEATSMLIAYIDTGYNLPLQTNGNDVNIQLDSGASKIFRLVNP
jgi:hypothetical protein